MLKRTYSYWILIILILASAFFYFFAVRTALHRNVQQLNELAETWLFENLKDNGLFVYSLDPRTAEAPHTNNTIRQLMASRILAEKSNNNPKLRPLHQKNLDFIFKYWYRTDGDIGYIYYTNKSKLGANAMLLRTLIASPFFDTYTERAAELAHGILALQHEDGSFDAWYVAPTYAYDEERLLTFYSGEALLALVEYFEKTGDEHYLEAAKRSADFYLDAYVTHIEENYYPAYVPWHTIALEKLYTITGDPRYPEAVFVMNDKLLELQDTTMFRGRFFNPNTPQYGNPHTASDAVYTEGLAYAYELADLTHDVTHKKRYREAIELSLYNLGTLQYTDPSPLLVSEPQEYIGALRTRADSTWIRVDTTQHALDAFTKLLEIF